MCASSMALMFSIVPYLVSKVDVSGPQSPAKIDVPEQIEHGLIVHHLARRDQHSQDDATFASIHDVVVQATCAVSRVMRLPMQSARM